MEKIEDMVNMKVSMDGLEDESLQYVTRGEREYFRKYGGRIG